MFGKSRKNTFPRIDTVIGEKTCFKGDVHFEGGLHVDGRVEGDVVADAGTGAVLTISESGSIQGDVRVPNLELNGTVTGDVHASERVELASHARVTGNLYYHLIEMAMGAEVNGNLVHVSEGREDNQTLTAEESPSEVDAMCAAK